jgi:hypothetical protein
VKGRRSLAKHRPIVTEDRSIKNMTACAKGTAEAPGKNVKQSGKKLVSGILLDPRRHRSSQTCPSGGTVRKKRCPSVSTIASVGSRRREIKPQPVRCWPMD